MNVSARLGIVLAIILIFASTAMACNISVSALDVGLKSENDTQFYESTSAPISSDISIKIQFNIDSYSGTDCPANIGAKAIISRYNNSTGNWDQYKTTSTKSQSLSNGTVILTWTDEFNTGNNDNYTEYRVEGDVMQDSTVLDSQEATVDVSNNSCSGVNLVTNDLTIDEGSTTTRSFRVENNTDLSFNINALNLYFTSSLISSGNLNYDNFVSAHSSRTINVSLTSGFVSQDQITSGRLELSGNLGGTSCSAYDIGVQTFNVTVRDTGANDNSFNNYYNNGYYDNYYNNGYSNNYYNNYGTSSACGDLELLTPDFSIDESTNQNVTFGIQNNSTNRFELQEIQLTNNGVQLSNFDNDKYVFPGQIGSIILRATAPNVLQDKEYQNSIKVRGMFANGGTCSFNDLNQQFTATVIASPVSSAVNCSGFKLTAPATLTLDNFGTIPFTISNMSNKSADIYVEGTADAVPTLIALPSNTAITRSLNVTLAQKSGYVNFRPVVEGCMLPITTVNISNTSASTGNTSPAGGNSGNSTGFFSLGENAAAVGIILLIVIIVVLLVAVISGYGKAKGKEDTEQSWVKK